MRPLSPLRAALLLLGLALFCGCTGIAPGRSVQNPPPQPVADAGAKGWWAVRFQMNWPEDAPPAWYMDTLIAHRVVAPALGHYQEQIDLWRFHRRASRDSAGHQFSFIFYTDLVSARLITDELRIRASGLLSLNRQRGPEGMGNTGTSRFSAPFECHFRLCAGCCVREKIHEVLS